MSSTTVFRQPSFSSPETHCTVKHTVYPYLSFISLNKSCAYIVISSFDNNILMVLTCHVRIVGYSVGGKRKYYCYQLNSLSSSTWDSTTSDEIHPFKVEKYTLFFTPCFLSGSCLLLPFSPTPLLPFSPFHVVPEIIHTNPVVSHWKFQGGAGQSQKPKM